MLLTVTCEFFILFALSLTQEVNYSEIRKLLLGKTCAPKDTCQTRTRQVDDLQIRHCMCDFLCEEYDDCCVDAVLSGYSKEQWKCASFTQFGYLYIKHKCKEDWVGNDKIHTQCENDVKKNGGLISAMPVSNSETGVTYKNYFCAICNGELLNKVIWTPRLECPTIDKYYMKDLTTSEKMRNLTYENLYQSWGFWINHKPHGWIFHNCTTYPQMPDSMKMKYRSCREDLVSECPPTWKDNEVKQKCATYMGAMYTRHKGYRNIHCAICNNISLTELRCRSTLSKGVAGRTFNFNAFSLLFDININMGDIVGKDAICEYEERYDIFLKRCVNTVCGLSGYKYVSGECILPQLSMFTNDSSGFLTKDFPSQVGTTERADLSTELIELSVGLNKTHQETTTITSVNDTTEQATNRNASISTLPTELMKKDIFEYPQDFKTCPKVNIHDDEYILIGNDDIFVPKYKKAYNRSYYIFQGTSLLVCINETSLTESKETFSVYMGYVSNIGLGISVICLILHFIIFIIVPELQNICGRNLASLSVALIISYSCFILGQFNILSNVACFVIAIVMYYFFLASFFWMNILAFDVWRTLRMATKDLRLSGGRQWCRFVSYSMFCWIVPIIIVVLSVIVENIRQVPQEYKPAFGINHCWFNHRKPLLVFFAAPVATIMFVNIIFFVLSARMIVATSNTTAKHQSSCSSPKRNLQLYTKLALLMGLSWAFGLVAGYSGLEVLWYIFVFFNTLQGVFIFFAFSCTKKIRKHLIDKIFTLSKPSAYRTTSMNSGSGSGSGYQSHCTLSSQLVHGSSSLGETSPNHNIC